MTGSKMSVAQEDMGQDVEQNVLMWDTMGQDYFMWHNISSQEIDWRYVLDLSIYGDWYGEYLEDGRQVVWIDYPGYWWR